MELSKEIIESIERFAEKEAQEHLSDEKLNLLERLSKKGNKAAEIQEASDELATYMKEYIKDLLEHGISEEVAFEMVKEKLVVEQEKEYEEESPYEYNKYYMDMDIDMARQEALGLYFAGFALLGISIGSTIGLLLGLTVFSDKFWTTFGVCTGLGTLMGVSLAMLKNAAIIMKNSKI